MKTARQTLLDWAEKGVLPPAELRRALSLAGVFPSADDWRRFLNGLFLWLGTALVLAGVIFFFAYNWNDLGRFFKIGLIETLVVAALFFVWRLNLERMTGKAALLAASAGIGALFALIGQTYQTGADTYELFAVWAALILPWVLIGRFPALWLFWLLLVNLATVFYYQTFGGLFGLLFATKKFLWVLFILNLVALAVWEGVAASGVAWLRERWAPRIIATVAGGLITALALDAVFDRRNDSLGGPALPVWLVWLSGTAYIYRALLLDVYALAGGVLSLIFVVTALAGKLLEGWFNADVMLFLGLVVIGLSAAGGWWLKQAAGGGKE